MRGTRFALILVAVLILLLSVSGAWATVIRVTTSGNNGNNGSSWANAKLTVQAAITAAASGDQVWVKAGTYVENITLKSGVALYGGFAGTETALTERAGFPRAYRAVDETALDGNNTSRVINIADNASSYTRIDGFTIRNGKAPESYYNFGGGIRCVGGEAVITNNIIVDNRAEWSWYSGDSRGGGIYCEDSGATISNNLICNNYAANYGGGIACNGGYPTIINNRMIENNVGYGGSNGGGIACYNGMEGYIANNTIVKNLGGNGGGIFCDGDSSSYMVNNIVAFNTNGIYNGSGNGIPELHYNCVYGNTDYDYSGISAGATDFSDDPLLASVEWNELHIQANSPCKDAGDDSVPETSWLDMDGQARIQGSHVDVGADESDGTTWNYAPYIVRVSKSGDDSHDGSTWSLAKLTIQAAVNAVQEHDGGEIWVASGTYYEHVVIGRHVNLYGGFAGTETNKSQRNWKTNITTIDGQNTGTVVTSITRDVLTSCIDGFTITNGEGQQNQYSYYSGGGISTNGGVTIKNNIITNNSTEGTGGGILCGYGSPVICDNTITNNTASYGASIEGYGNGTIANNLITDNTGTSEYDHIYGALSVGEASFINNTVADNTGGIDVSGTGVVANNIIAFNTYGLNVSVTPEHNDVYGNVNYNYTAYSTPGPTDISVNPLFVNGGTDYHLRGDSPCVNTGLNSRVDSGWLDIDSQTRINTLDGIGIADIGCDESYAQVAVPVISPNGGAYPSTQSVTITCGTSEATIHYTTNGTEPTVNDSVYSSAISITANTTLKAKAFKTNWTSSTTTSAVFKIYKIIRVDGVNGDDANDGSSWTLAKETIGDAFTDCVAGDEIWVKAGTYDDVRPITADVSLYGGFAGDETLRDQRDWSVNVTTLDGAGYYYINDTTGATVLSGFTIKNNGYYVGAGVLVSGSPTISYNIIRNNTAQYYGGGICLSNGSAKIINNIFYNNHASYYGGAIYCGSDTSPIITNNTLDCNGAANGGGIYIASGSSPTICNNVLWGNSSGIYAQSGSDPYLRCNGVYQVIYSGYAYSGLDPGEGDITCDMPNRNNMWDWWPGADGVDAGWNDAPGIPDKDINGQPRIFGTVDMGANELYLLHVSPTGSDSNNGVSWSAPKATIQAALDVTKSPVVVWVKEGTYYQTVDMRRGDEIHGGFAGTEVEEYERDYSSPIGESVLDADSAGTVIYIDGQPATQEAIVDRFTITNGAASVGGGIYCYGSPLIQRNKFVNNYAGYGAGGICCNDGSPLIHDNLFLGNSTYYAGGAILCGDTSSAFIAFNTFVDNDALDGGAIYMSEGSSPMILSNICYDNPNSIYAYTGVTPTFLNNDVYNSSSMGYLYSGLTPAASNISLSPMFVGSGDYHLATGSPCIDTGYWGSLMSSNYTLMYFDLDFMYRPRDGNGDTIDGTDMGCYERQ